ncbi:hypothetical protein [Spirulina subsalsa]|uniref:hypothetical protein n=1 Tax=Spirulina subsalsa TaxID=54311 RepID=UPI0002F8B657|nr:hypothetical protein [Spirulina subsalsa]
MVNNEISSHFGLADQTKRSSRGVVERTAKKRNFTFGSSGGGGESGVGSRESGIGSRESGSRESGVGELISIPHYLFPIPYSPSPVP